MKNLLFSLLATLLLSASNIAAAACSYLNISNSGTSVASGASQIVHEFSISCLGTVSFTFKDLSGNKPTSVIKHSIEKKEAGSWTPISETTSNGALTVNRSFFPSSTGTYRYRIENKGTSEVHSWSMEGRKPMFTIPGT